jgi:para-aminobenzoate synthetase component 1
VGYWGYDLCHFLERLPRRAEDDLHLPDCALGFYDVVVAFDHLEGEAFIISSGLPELEPRTAEKRARARTEELLGLLHNTRSKTESRQEIDTRPTLARKAGAKARNYSDFASNFTLTEYLSAVQKAKQYIAAGDIYQVNLSQRFEVPITTGSFSVYDRLRQVSPAPFAAFLNFPEVAVASASPERFLRVTGRRIQTCPIKGTRPRGKEVSEDEQLAWDLQHSPKDLAENTMIVDLERNDLGKVCRYGSVEVMKFASLEAYSNVFHLVSTVEGELRPEVGHIDCLSACFPGGSITGAPKIRAMEIIDELEPTCRSAYTGAIGYLGWDGNMDLNIVIRTLLMARGKGWFQVGGGIVADSDPEAEYQETLDKAAGLFAALVEPSQLRAKSCHSPTQITERAALAAGVGRS